MAASRALFSRGSTTSDFPAAQCSFFGKGIRPCAFRQFARRLDLSANCLPSESAAQKMLSTRSWEPDTRDGRHRRELRREAAECCEVAALSARSAPSLGVIAAGHRRACFDQIRAPLPRLAACPRRGWQVSAPGWHARSTRAYLPGQAERAALSRASALRPRAAAFFHRVTAQLVLVVLGAANALSAHPTPSASQPGDTPALVAMLASVSSRPPPRDFGGETKSPQISAFFPRLLRSHRGATEHRTHCGHHVAGGSRHRLFHSGLLASLQPELVAKSHRTEREGILVWF